MDKSVLENQINQKYSQDEIANNLGVSRTTLRWWLKKYNLVAQSRHKYYGNNSILYKRARELRSQGYGYKSIERLLDNDVPWSTIRNWVSDIKVSRSEATVKYKTLARVPLEQLKSKDSIRKRLIEDRGCRCEWCGSSEWLGKQLSLEMHRLDGKDSPYNKVDRIALLCPNCHSTTDDYRRSKRM